MVFHVFTCAVDRLLVADEVMRWWFGPCSYSPLVCGELARAVLRLTLVFFRVERFTGKVVCGCECESQMLLWGPAVYFPKRMYVKIGHEWTHAPCQRLVCGRQCPGLQDYDDFGGHLGCVPGLFEAEF